jgi:hypothetical protein
LASRPSLVRTYPFDHDRAINGLRNRAFQTFPVAGTDIDLVAEPLLRRGPSGLEQPLRLRTTKRLTRACVELPGGLALDVSAEPAPGGARFFIPAVEHLAVCRVRLPELGDETVELEVLPVRRWDVSLVHHSHFDIGYTDLQGRVITEQLAYLDDALRLAEAEPEGGPSSFRWSVESIWVLREWIARRRPETVARFMAQVRSGRIEVAALPFNLHTETCSTEELHGLLRYARAISEHFGLELPVAYQTDVPGCVAGTVDALADAGVKYLAVAHNWAGRSVPYLGEGEHLPRLFWWASPAGNRVLVWMTTTAQGMAYQEAANLGFCDSIDRVEDLLPLFLHNEQTLPFPYDDNCFGFALGDREFDRAPYPWNEIHLRVMGRVGDNCPPNRRLNEIVAAWNARWEYPKLKVTRTQDFFEQVEAAHADEIETYIGDWNDWWADGVGSSARHMQMNRGSQARLAQLTSVAALLSEAPSGFAERLEQAWEAVELFDEHTWGAALPWTHGDTAYETGTDQWHWKAEKAIRAEQDSLLLEQEVLRAFADEQGGAGEGSIWVINTSATARGGIVCAFLPESLVHTTATIRLVDSTTGAELVFRERNQTNPVHRAAGRFVELRIDDVPALGSRRVDVVVEDSHGRPAAPDGTIPREISGKPVWHLDNGRLRVEVDPSSGAISSILDLSSGTELVNSGSAFGFNAYVHDRLAPRGAFNHLSGFVADSGPDLVLLADRSTTTHVAFEECGSDALGTWLRYRSFGIGVDSILTTLRLDAGSIHLDIENRVSKPWTSDKESGFFAFPFTTDRATDASGQPTVRFEVSGSVAGTDLPALPGGASYLHVVRDWVTLHAGDRAAALVTPDAPLIQVGDIALPFAPFPGTLREVESGTVFSWIHNNIWDTNFPAGQAWDMAFRYRVAGFACESTEEACVRSAELASDLVRPLLGVAADPFGEPVDESSLLSVDDPRVRLISITRTPEGQLLVALQSIAQSSVPIVIRSSRPVLEAWRATLLGRRRDRLDVEGVERVELEIAPFGTSAVELRLA